MNNKTAYLKYFEWKRDYRVHGDRHINDHMVCEACKYLHDFRAGKIPRKSYKFEMINKFWMSTCWKNERVEALYKDRTPPPLSL